MTERIYERKNNQLYFLLYMSFMFSYAGYNATSWNVGDLSSWDTSNVINMENMFAAAGNMSTIFDIGNLSNWNTSKVDTMHMMFMDSQFNQPIGNWDVSKVDDIDYMFYNSKFNQDINGWNPKNVKSPVKTFDNCPLQNNPPIWYEV